MDGQLGPYPGADELVKGDDGFNVDMNNWGNLDFSTKRVDYTDDEEPTGMKEKLNRTIIGTTGLASCAGVVILTQDRVVVGHYSSGCLEDGSRRDELPEDGIVQHLLNNKNDLKNGRAWIIHCGSEAPITRGAPTDDHDAGRQLYATLTKVLEMPKETIAVLKYKPPQESEPAGSIMVDGRNSPLQMATVYAQGFQQLEAYVVNP
ncbi:hypothetical protein GGR51DRAFT_558520 [Nemania sp. FL0031]|nr:hypothetical protein GGR51DRAFT_558520 [Nemania sp. FL0031]